MTNEFINAVNEIRQNEKDKRDQTKFADRKREDSRNGGKELRVHGVDRHGIPLGKICALPCGEVQKGTPQAAKAAAKSALNKTL